MNRLNDRTQFLVSMAYDGSRFYGVQEQGELPTVLGALRKRIEQSVSKRTCCLTASARTDRGVHALNNYATFYVRGLTAQDVEKLISDVEQFKDDGLFGVSISLVSHHVHARSCSKGKVYRYTIVDSSESSSHFAWHVAPDLDVNAMAQAASYMVGEKDFSSLRGGGCEAGTAIKEITSIEVTRTKTGEILIEVYGNAFLRKMIRNLVGLLAEIGSGLRRPESVEEILLKKCRSAAGIMAEAQGLCLISVEFLIPSSLSKSH